MPKNFRAISIRERGKTFLVSPIVVTLHSLKIGRLWEIDNLSLHLYSCWMVVVLKGDMWCIRHNVFNDCGSASFFKEAASSPPHLFIARSLS